MSRLFSINSLKQFRCRVLFSTDLTARGIDARNVNLVINADVAWDADTHLHRTGRAGRYGTKGVTVTVAAAEGEEFERLRKIVYKTGSKIWILKRPGDDDEEEDKEGDGDETGKVGAKKPVDIFDFDGESLDAVEPLECDDEDGKMLRSEVKENGVEGEKKGKNKRGGKKHKRKKEEEEEDPSANFANDPTIHAVDARSENLRVISGYLKSRNEGGSNKPKMPTKESVSQAVEKFRNGTALKESSNVTYRPPPKEVLESLSSYLDENEYLLKSGLDDVRQRLQDLPLEECLKIAGGELPVPEPPAPPVEEALQMPEYYSQNFIPDSGVANLDPEGDIMCSDDLVPSLPHPDLSECHVYDQASLDRWLMQVQENAEFIRFMEFKRKMDQLEHQRNQ